MKTKSVLIAILVAAAIGGGGCCLFSYLADKTRREAADRLKALDDLQRDINLRDSLSRIDSINVAFSSFDLSFHELHGRVRYVSYGEENVSFDRDGHWTNPETYISRGGNSLVFDRDKFGCIVRGATTGNDGGEALERVEYTWSGNRLKRIDSKGASGDYRVDFIYDNNRLLSQTSTVSSDNESKSEIVTTYSYHDFDDHGNWTRRTARSAIKTTVAGGYFDEDSGRFIDGDEPVLDSTEETQVRKITYYTD